ncbi:MAG: transglutaminase family protein [Pseudomonadota bacterium]
MLLHVVHETRYDYSPSVENAHHVVCLQPGDHSGQRLVRHNLDIQPAPSSLQELADVYGNPRTFFSLETPHDRLCVVADSLIETSRAREPGSVGPAWEKVREYFRYHTSGAWDPACEFVFASPYVPRDEAFADFARASFLPGRPVLEAASDLMRRIYRHMKYETLSTDVNTPALEALAQGKGVCQDFAHIMVACCRAMGLPARYVSGYLLTQPPPGQPRLIGSDASHAWASVYCPASTASPQGHGELAWGQWVDFDPTNDRSPGEDYVTLATGRDFLDVSPMRGVIRGGARHALSVAVTVAPAESAEPADLHGR